MTTTLQLVSGDDYAVADGRAQQFSLDGTVLPDLSNSAVSLVLQDGRPSSPVVISGEITVATGATRTVRFQLTHAQTVLLQPTMEGRFFVVLTLLSGRTISPLDARGTLTILAGQRTSGGMT